MLILPPVQRRHNDQKARGENSSRETFGGQAVLILMLNEHGLISKFHNKDRLRK